MGKRQKKVAKRLEARKNSYASRGSGKVADMLRQPGSQNRKK